MSALHLKADINQHICACMSPIDLNRRLSSRHAMHVSTNMYLSTCVCALPTSGTGKIPPSSALSASGRRKRQSANIILQSATVALICNLCARGGGILQSQYFFQTSGMNLRNFGNEFAEGSAMRQPMC
jgi:hypothetical protein